MNNPLLALSAWLLRFIVTSYFISVNLPKFMPLYFIVEVIVLLASIMISTYFYVHKDEVNRFKNVKYFFAFLTLGASHIPFFVCYKIKNLK